MQSQKQTYIQGKRIMACWSSKEINAKIPIIFFWITERKSTLQVEYIIVTMKMKYLDENRQMLRDTKEGGENVATQLEHGKLWVLKTLL